MKSVDAVPVTVLLPSYLPPRPLRGHVRQNYVPQGYAPSAYAQLGHPLHHRHALQAPVLGAPAGVPAPPRTERLDARFDSRVPPPASRLPVSPSSAPLPVLVSDIDRVSEEEDEEIRRLRKGSGVWSMIAAAALTLGIVASVGLGRQAGVAAKRASAASSQAGPTTAFGEGRDRALELERQLRAARSQGEWVETDKTNASASASASASALAPPVHRASPPRARR
jgi:hypothetical protein